MHTENLIPTFQHSAQLLMAEEDLDVPSTPEEALALYFSLIQHITSM
ncbi:hypothetical protein SPBRAN_1152 [uncultured Candidatus Thioglobus sp.]|nr:hypothetical protein SPBRAN_1152 [uncultured Candidatus Thioglobus sp.]